MCTICGGVDINDPAAFSLFIKSRDRGSDYGNLFIRGNSWICNHRAIPTTELEAPDKNQPFGTTYKIVHNGTIANDAELGNSDEIDSSVLPDILSLEDIKSFRESLSRINGSYAIAVLKPDGTFYLACNYKPIFLAIENDEVIAFSSLKHHLSIYKTVVRMKPYSVMDTATNETIELPRCIHDKAVVVCSGGLDSTAVAAYAKSHHEEIGLIHFDYGCKAGSKEKEAVERISKRLGCDLYVIPIDYSFDKTSSLVNGGDITSTIVGAEYAHEWVPARNLVMLSLAVAFAEANGYSYVYTGANLEESGAYPDNEPQFMDDFNSCLWGAVQNGNYVEVRTPLATMMKHDIVRFGLEYDAPFDISWSCYKDGENHCGECAPCFMRRTAFQRENINDPTIYEV